MRLVNHSGQPAELMQGEIVPGQMHGSVLTRLRCRLGPDSSLSLATGDDALLDLRRDRIEDEYGVIEPDIPYPRTATDVIVLADARCPGGPKVATKVGLRVGPYEQELLVIGDRVWERSLGAVTPSSPVPFELMPLTWAHAFGGPAQGPYGPVQHPANPLGKGYALDAGAAVGQPLPNIEDPQAPIRAWNDRPDPVGFGPYPFNWLLRQQQCVEIVPGPEREARLLMYPERGMFDRAHPRLSGQQLRPGDAVIVTGTSFAPRIAFALPPCPFELEIRIGGKTWVRELELEELLLDLRRGLVELSYRKLLKYPWVPHQRREVVLRIREPEATSHQAPIQA
ncbi:MAG: DUF2169 domain-containing protein [Myxococcales bacterium]|nr:DUF2169 domain-containing protein [Myxococcales bacterium]MCB9717572.1 DUF2169 domain-containing protein [Myxococcales bacterium]